MSLAFLGRVEAWALIRWPVGLSLFGSSNSIASKKSRSHLILPENREVDLSWETIFDGRQYLMEDKLWWETSFDERQPWMKDYFHWKMTWIEWCVETSICQTSMRSFFYPFFSRFCFDLWTILVHPQILKIMRKLSLFFRAPSLFVSSFSFKLSIRNPQMFSQKKPNNLFVETK